MKHLGMVVLVSLLMLGCAQENTEQDQGDPPSQDGAAQEFRVGEISFSVDSLEAGDGGVTLSVTVANGGSEAISLNRENLEPLLVNDKGDMAFGSLPEDTEVAAGASASFDLNFAGLSGGFFTLAFNAPKNLIISGPGVWPVYYVGPILTDGVTHGSQTGSEALDLAVTGDLTSFAYLGSDCYAPTRISLTDANGTVYVLDYGAGLLANAPELKVSDSVGEPSYEGELYFAPLLESSAGPLTLNFNACTADAAQERAYSPPLTIEGIPLPAQ